MSSKRRGRIRAAGQEADWADQEARACGNKVRYPDMHKAGAVAGHYRRQGDPDIWAYKCTYCGAYHIGHSTAYGSLQTAAG